MRERLELNSWLNNSDGWRTECVSFFCLMGRSALVYFALVDCPGVYHGLEGSRLH